jgi:hypothetical protein
LPEKEFVFAPLGLKEGLFSFISCPEQSLSSLFGFFANDKMPSFTLLTVLFVSVLFSLPLLSMGEGCSKVTVSDTLKVRCCPEGSYFLEGEEIVSFTSEVVAECELSQAILSFPFALVICGGVIVLIVIACVCWALAYLRSYLVSRSWERFQIYSVAGAILDLEAGDGAAVELNEYEELRL